MTKTSATMGSPFYMAPEQMQSARDVDPRSDIWALGVVLYELITGKLPFPAETMAELVLKVVTGTPTPLRDMVPDAPAALQSLILKCLEKDRGQRYPTVGALAFALLEFAPRRSKSSVERISGIMQRAGMSATALEVPPSSDPNDDLLRAGLPGTLSSWGQTAPPAASRRRAVLATVLLVGTMVGVAGFVLRRTPSVPSVASQAVALDSVQPAIPDASLVNTAVAPERASSVGAPLVLAAESAPALTVPQRAPGGVKKPVTVAHSTPGAAMPTPAPPMASTTPPAPVAQAAVQMAPPGSTGTSTSSNPLRIKPK